MTETLQSNLNIAPELTLPEVQAKISQTLAEATYYDPSGNTGLPQLGSDVIEFMSSDESFDQKLLVDYARVLKFRADGLEQYRQSVGKEPEVNYYAELEKLFQLSTGNLQNLYSANDGQNPMTEMIRHQFQDKETNSTAAFSRQPADIIKKVYGSDTIPGLILTHSEDDTLVSLGSNLRDGRFKLDRFYAADVGLKKGENGLPTDRFARGSRENRQWMREALMVATGITYADQADAYTYSSSRNSWGSFGLDTLANRIKSFGSEKLETLRSFAGIDALTSFSDAQLERMYKLATGDEEEVKRLQEHDVVVALINLQGDHNGISADVASRLDDEDGTDRTLFFEINRPEQVYGDLKKLYDLGIAPTTLIFASHGSPGQFFISERPSLDASEDMGHVTLVVDKDVADHQTARAQANGENVIGYSIANANGLIRGVQRFMQPSRGIDDPDNDLGRKKIISLSCGFDQETRKATLGENDEVVREDKTSLLRSLGEVIVNKLEGEHIDIYGADISTNSQTRTKRGFHYNTIREGARSPYYASVLHIDGQHTQWHRLNEVRLRKG